MGRLTALSLVPVSAIMGCAIDEAGLDHGDAGADVAVVDAGHDVTVLPDAGKNDAADATADVTLPPACNPTAAFGSLVDLPSINSGAAEVLPSLTSDELTMYFARSTSGNHVAIFYATRTTTAQPFGSIMQASSIAAGNSTYDSAPFVVDGLKTIFFQSEDATGNPTNAYHLYQATGSGALDGWSNPTALPIDTFDPATDAHPFWSPASSEMWFATTRGGLGYDLYVAVNNIPLPATPLNNFGNNDIRPVLSADGLTIFFARDDSSQLFHVWTATRSSTLATFGFPTEVADFDSGGSNNVPGWLSTDGCRMYFFSDRSGGKGNWDIWMATRPP